MKITFTSYSCRSLVAHATKYCCFICLAFSGVFLSSHVLAASSPVGSYNKSCSAISVAGDTLLATCEKLDSSVNNTSLSNLAACLSSINQYGDIGNIDGNLICLPDLPKADSGFKFPESETTVNAWVYGSDTTKIVDHGWGIWAGLTSVVGAVDGVNVLAFETWNTPTNMIYQIETLSSSVAGNKQKLKKAGVTGLIAKPPRLELALPHQFKNRKDLNGKLKNAIKAATPSDGDTNIFVSVAYNPPAAQHAISNKLFLQSTLNKYIEQGYTDIPNFPNNAITIKPVYKVITAANTVNGIYTFPGWPGTPDPARTFAESDWDSCAYIDVNGSGPGGNSIDLGCKGRDSTNTFFLSNFIHNKITSDDAKYLKSQLGITASAGDYAILVGMHVTSREIKRWAWQTFFWTANTSNPYSPSSASIAAQQPSSLAAAAKHYAMSIAYQMVDPAQPITGGANVGQSHIAYNPHLEASFDQQVFQINRAIGGTQYNEFGVQTNCMTCHNLAQYDPKVNYSENSGANRETPYGTDYYMSIDDQVFDKVLRLDFAWSIIGSLKLDDQ
ncbi:MAG: hypothetical protein ACI9Y1_003467 [Lentisphaeria bacterium]|jgi:hypothetical protein